MSKRYGVKQVADLSGVTVRALHHYDKIGLLKPAGRSEKKYRFYNEHDLLRLQQILFYRELEFSLEQTREILDNPEFDFANALRTHRKKLVHRNKRIKQLIHTVDQTLEKIEGESLMSLNDKDLYEGFDQEKIQRWNKEIEEKYDPGKVAESKQNIKNMNKEKFRNIKQRGEEVTLSIASLMDKDPEDESVQAWIKEHHLWVENFYTCSAEMYKGLGLMYVQNPEFTEYYENIRPGLAKFMSDAMGYYADNTL